MRWPSPILAGWPSDLAKFKFRQDHDTTNTKSTQPKVFSEFRLPFQQLDTRHLSNGRAASGFV